MCMLRSQRFVCQGLGSAEEKQTGALKCFFKVPFFMVGWWVECEVKVYGCSQAAVEEAVRHLLTLCSAKKVAPSCKNKPHFFSNAGLNETCFHNFKIIFSRSSIYESFVCYSQPE